jgi:hypothetical protein
MCRRATCKTCGKTTWAGCGQHVNQVMATVPEGDRCPGHRASDALAARSAETRKSPEQGSWLTRLFGR